LLSHESETCNRSPAISPAAFDTRPPDLPPASLMDMDFAISCPLVRRRRPQIQFLSIGPYLCSTLPLDPTSRWCPCASLPFTSIRLGPDFHPLAAEHARRTAHTARLKSCPPELQEWLRRLLTASLCSVVRSGLRGFRGSAMAALGTALAGASFRKTRERRGRGRSRTLATQLAERGIGPFAGRFGRGSSFRRARG
jgi:hypothetical protein